MYRIIGADGKEYGPIPVEQLRQWLAEGRANAQTKVRAEGSTEWRMLSELPEFAAAAAGAPPAIGPTPAVPAMPFSTATSPAADLVNGPGIGLIVAGALNIVFAIGRGVMMLAGIGVNTFQSNGGNDAQKMIMGMMGTFGLLFGVIGLLGGIIILFGGVKMRRLESYGFCMTASIVAMVPCLSACCLIGLPIGIWAVIVLSKPEVKNAFH
jgi:hypothetical protein